MSRGINAGWLQDTVRAMCGIQGGENPVPDLSVVQPSLELDRCRPEWLWPRNELLEANFAFVAAGGVGNPSCIGLRNPAKSGYLAILERVWARGDPAGTASRIELAWSTALALFVARGRTPRDSREGTAFLAGGVEFVTSNANATAALGLQTITAFDPSLEGAYKEPIIIDEGAVLVVLGFDATGTRLLNLPLMGSIDWRVKPMHKGRRG